VPSLQKISHLPKVFTPQVWQSVSGLM